MRTRTVTWLAAALVLVACGGGPPQPGEPGYAYNVMGLYTGSLSVEGQGFRFVVRLRTGPGGVVRGNYEVTQPVQLSGQVEGTLAGEHLELSMLYTNNPMTGCNGEVAGTLTVEEGGGTLSGPMTVTDCGQLLGATARLTRDEG